ncbi:catabolite repression HPr-like protein [Lachnospiraceae bacterium KH1T2]|nr:catabolite repression HPr-like protein [Lachnospiraceae bacterium KH1T2]
MKKQTVTVSLKEDMDTRPIAMLVQMASQFDSSVYIEYDSKHVNAKSIMGMMTLALKNGDDVDVVTDGVDEDAASENIVKYLTGEAKAAV